MAYTPIGNAYAQVIRSTSGPVGTVAIGTVTTGGPGTPASVTNSGNSFGAILNFVIPTGPQGIGGTVSVGTVTTLPSGSQATITNSGTPQAAVLDFALPAGPTGTAYQILPNNNVWSGTNDFTAKDILVPPSSQSENPIQAGELLDGDGSLVGYNQGSTGALLRTSQSKFQERVSIMDFGANPSLTDNTTKIQNALNSGELNIEIPPFIFNFEQLTITPHSGLCFTGKGPASSLVQQGAGIKFAQGSAISYMEGTIGKFQIVGGNGTGHCIDTTGIGGTDIVDMFITNLPVGFNGINIDGMNGVYTHDMRLFRPRIYTNTAGNAGIAFGPLASDSSVAGYICDMGFVADYCMQFLAGSGGIFVSGSHPYNALKNIINIVGNSTAGFSVRFSDCTLDNCSGGDIISITNSIGSRFIGCRIEAINSGYNGATLSACINTSFIDVSANGAGGTLAIIQETNGTKNTLVLGGGPDYGEDANFSALYNLSGSQSMVRFVGPENPYGTTATFNGISQAPSSAGQTFYLGANGSQSDMNATAFLSNYESYFQSINCAVDVAPGNSETFIVNLLVNGATVAGGTISGGGEYSLSIPYTGYLAPNDQFCLEVVTSSGAAAAYFRSSISISY